jgi:hypothetical protein
MGAAESQDALVKGASYEGDQRQDQDPLAFLLGGLGLGTGLQETRGMDAKHSDQGLSIGTADEDLDSHTPVRGGAASANESCVHVALSPAIEKLLARHETQSVKSAGPSVKSAGSVVSGSSSREERQGRRLEASRDRSRSRSRSRSRRGTPSGTSSSRYLSDDSDEGEPDGLVIIQCALDSEAYRDRVDRRFHNLRSRKDDEWRIHGRQSDIATFYDKKAGQNIRDGERNLLGALKKSDDIVGHSKYTRKKQNATFWEPYRGTSFAPGEGPQVVRRDACIFRGGGKDNGNGMELEMYEIMPPTYRSMSTRLSTSTAIPASEPTHNNGDMALDGGMCAGSSQVTYVKTPKSERIHDRRVAEHRATAADEISRRQLDEAKRMKREIAFFLRMMRARACLFKGWGRRRRRRRRSFFAIRITRTCAN